MYLTSNRAKKMTQLKTIFISTICMICCNPSIGFSQNVYKDYVQDKHAQYSPFDHANRGLIYKMQTGHAGWFGKCDDDRQKMVSPYIDWHCRKPDACLPVQFTKDLFADIFRKSDRLRDSAGGCACGNCQSDDCNGNCQTPIQNAPEIQLGNQNQIAPHQQRIASKPIRLLKPSAKPSGKSNAGIYGRAVTQQNQTTTKPQQPNSLATQAGSSRNYFSGNNQQQQISQPRSNDPRFANGASGVVPATYQKPQLLKGNARNSADPRFSLTVPQEELKTQKSATQRLPQQSRTSVSSTPAQGQKADPQHFQFRLIGGSTNR